MRIGCLWSPAWRTGGEPPAELAAALLEVVPRVATDARGPVWVDLGGLRDPGAAAAEVVRRADPGATGDVRLGVAGVGVAAEAAARTGETRIMEVPAGAERDFLAPLPLDVLEPEARLLTLLEAAGITRCGRLAALEREPVEVRFGAAGVALWRLARADDRRRRFHPIPPEPPSASVDFLDHVVREAGRLAFAAHGLTAPVCEGLRARGERAHTLLLVLALEGGGEMEVPIRLSRPTARRERWSARIREVLDTLTLPDAVSGLLLRPLRTTRPVDPQGDLFDRGFATAGAVEEALGRATDAHGEVLVRPERSRHPLASKRLRWAGRVGAAEPGSPSCHSRESGNPASFQGGGSRDASSTTLDPRVRGDDREGSGDDAERTAQYPASSSLAFQRLEAPRAVGVRTEAGPEGERPVALRERNGWTALETVSGPERCSGETWDEAYAREAFVCVTRDGRLLRLVRDARAGRWEVEGWWG